MLSFHCKISVQKCSTRKLYGEFCWSWQYFNLKYQLMWFFSLFHVFVVLKHLIVCPLQTNIFPLRFHASICDYKLDCNSGIITTQCINAFTSAMTLLSLRMRHLESTHYYRVCFRPINAASIGKSRRRNSKEGFRRSFAEGGGFNWKISHFDKQKRTYFSSSFPLPFFTFF